jgi:hypothetical protein
LSQKVVTIRPSNPKLKKPENLKEEATKNRRVLDDEERRSDQEWMMKKLGIRRLDATSSHLVTKGEKKVQQSVPIFVLNKYY